jgi:hypothetical protein
MVLADLSASEKIFKMHHMDGRHDLGALEHVDGLGKLFSNWNGEGGRDDGG